MSFSSHWNVSWFEQVEGEVENAAFKAARDLGRSPLKPEQLQVVCTVLPECDVFAVLHTCFGKSLCFANLPLAYDYLYPSSEPSTDMIGTAVRFVVVAREDESTFYVLIMLLRMQAYTSSLAPTQLAPWLRNL